MTIRNNELDAGTDYIDGEALYSADVNDTNDAIINTLRDNYEDADDVVKTYIPKLISVYTGTGFDSSQTNAGSNEDNYETALISASDLIEKTYLRITLTGLSSMYVVSMDTNSIQLKIQTKYNGGSYTDSLPYTYMWSYGINDNINNSKKLGNSFVYYHTLTPSEKSNGMYVNLFSKSIAARTGCVISFTNINTSIEVI